MINFHIQRTQALSVYLQFSTLHLQRLAESPIDNNSPPKARIPKSQSPPPKPHQHPTTIAHQQPSPRAPPTTPSQPRPPFSNESPAPQRNTHSHTNHSHPAKSACAYDHLPSALLTRKENKMHQRVGKKREHTIHNAASPQTPHSSNTSPDDTDSPPSGGPTCPPSAPP